MKRTAVAVIAAASLVIAGCSDDDEPTESSDGTQAAEEGTKSEAELVADATTVAVAYFQARSVHDFGTAYDNADGAASLVIDWDSAVAGIEGLEGTPYEVAPVEAPEVRVNISGMAEGSDGTYEADGFVELGHRPSGVASTTTTEPPEGTEDLGEVSFVTDMEFVRDGNTMRLTDYRFDDVAYPVSELYVAGESDATDPAAVDTTGDTATTGDDDAAQADDADVTIVMGHRDMDGSVQWLVDHDDDAEVIDARFIEGEEPPAPDALGVALQVFPAPDTGGTGGTTGTTGDDGIDVDAPDGDEEGPDADTLVVHAGAFPGELPGTLRFQVRVAEAGDDPVVADAGVLEFPELGEPRDTNVVRDAERDVDDTTTTTEPDESTTTTEPEDEGETTTTTSGDGSGNTPTTSGDSTTSTSAVATTSTTELDGS